MIKRGQISLFMIIGTVLILSVGLATYFIAVSQSQRIKPSINLEQKRLSIAEYIESCFSDRVKEARNKYGLDKDKIERHVDENICKDFSEFEEKDLSISFTGAHTDVAISQDIILARMDYLVIIRLGLSSQSLEEFSFNMEVTTTTQIPTQEGVGVVSEDTVLRSGDGLLELFIAEGTIITDENGLTVDNPEITIKLTDVNPNPTTYGLGIYEVEPHLFFSQPATLRMRYYDLHLGKEENLKVIKRPGPGYVWKIVLDQDAPYTASNLMIARLTELSQIALTVTCGSGEEETPIEEGETLIYFYTNYVYIQNCEPCKCFVESEEADKYYYIDADVFDACENKKSPGPELEEEYDYSEEPFSELLLDERGGTTAHNDDGCKITDDESTLFYESIEAVGGTGSFDIEFNLEENACVDAVSFVKEDVDDEVSSITMDGESFDNWNDLFERVTEDVEEESTTYLKTIEVEVANTDEGEWGACSHERLLVEVRGTGIECPLPDEISPAKCCTTLEECDWGEGVGVGECNKLGFHTLVQGTGDQALIDKHLEVAHGFSGNNGWVLNTIWRPQHYDPAAYVEKATELNLRPIIRLDINYEKPSMEHIDHLVNVVDSIPGLKFVQFLNEPNIAWSDWGAAVEPQDYVDMLIEFHRQVGDEVYIIAGNLAPTGAGAPNIPTEEYITQMFSVDNVDELVDAIDIWGSHSKPRGEVDPVGDECEGCNCEIESVYGYRKELCLIEQKVPGFDKDVFLTETGYDVSKVSSDFVSENMKKAFEVWDADERLVGVTIYILAPIGPEWVSHRWATVPNKAPYEPVELTTYFKEIRDMPHSFVCPDIELPSAEGEGEAETGDNGEVPPEEEGENCITGNCLTLCLDATCSGGSVSWEVTISNRADCSGDNPDFVHAQIGEAPPGFESCTRTIGSCKEGFSAEKDRMFGNINRGVTVTLRGSYSGSGTQQPKFCLYCNMISGECVGRSDFCVSTTVQCGES